MISTNPSVDKRWQLKHADEALVASLQEALSQRDSLLARLFVLRGIATFEEAKDFMNPGREQLHDPGLMKGMERAVERIAKALEAGERIMVYGDYDVDGTTSVSLVYGYLRGKHPNIDYYIPDRYKEGYGISMQGIDYAHESGCTLLIALDCGIKAVQQVARANRYGLDVIICDHHLPGEVLPAAHAILDPKQYDCPYPFKELSGCGIGFKLMQALADHMGWPERDLMAMIDLVAISAACDIVPMVGENRVITALGLRKINEKPLPGVQALLKATQLNRSTDVTDLVFRVGPRINAAGRLSDARHAVQLLLGEGDSEGIDQKAQLLELHNADRQDLDKQTTHECRTMVLEDTSFADKRSLVLYRPHWIKGVIGIVASRLVDEFYKPTIVLTESEGMLAGSARSVHGFSIYDALQQCEDLLESFGGHFYAAGMKLKPEKYEAFRKRFEEVVAATIRPECRQRLIEIDAELPFDRIPAGKTAVDSKWWYNLQRFAPYGPENMRPVFMTRHVREIGEAREIGDGHLRCTFRDGMGNLHRAVGWGMAHLLPLLQEGPVDICYVIELNEWKEYRNLQLQLKDIKPSGVWEG